MKTGTPRGGDVVEVPVDRTLPFQTGNIGRAIVFTDPVLSPDPEWCRAWMERTRQLDGEDTVFVRFRDNGTILDGSEAAYPPDLVTVVERPPLP